jgi:hypothetical protein
MAKIQIPVKGVLETIGSAIADRIRELRWVSKGNDAGGNQAS